VIPAVLVTHHGRAIERKVPISIHTKLKMLIKTKKSKRPEVEKPAPGPNEIDYGSESGFSLVEFALRW
jgi:hypothetical protein